MACARRPVRCARKSHRRGGVTAVCMRACVQEYYLTFPTYYAHGLLVGTLRMEIGDSLHIVCKKTGLRADIDFHQKPTFGGADKHNALDGHIRRIPVAGAEPGTSCRWWLRAARPPHAHT